MYFMEKSTVANQLRKRLGEKARELRLSKGLTQQQVAENQNIRQNDLSAFENHGKKIGSLESVGSLFEFFGYELTVTESPMTKLDTRAA